MLLSLADWNDMSDTTPLRRQAGALLRQERLAQGLTQQELSARLGVSERTIQRWEAADSTVDLVELEVALRSLGLAVDLVRRAVANED